MNGSFFSQIYTNGAILSIFFYFSTPFLYACVFGMGLFFFCSWGWVGGYKGLSFPAKESPCYTNLRYLFILLSSEKNEPRSAAAVIGLLAFRYGRRRGLRNSLRSNSPRPFPSVSLATSPPDKGGIGDCCFCLYSNPLALWALPLYFCCAKHPAMLRDTARGECEIWFCYCRCFFNPSVLRPPPLYFAEQNTP